MKKLRNVFIALLITVPTIAMTPKQSSTNIGNIVFPNSGAPRAQEAFLRGVAALHNFWFDESADEFKQAQQLDPNFALAYWGEAMSHNHPLWAEQDIASARQILRRFGKTRKERLENTPTEREQEFMKGVEILYGQGDKLARDKAYEKHMAAMRVRYPKDAEVATLHALSILGTVRRGDQGFSRQMKAGAIALDLFTKYPNHPGAAHFVIHSFDDPEHAPLALPAAEKYAQIAPEASHALHMPSHIFLQHGMWDRVAQSNLEAFDASSKWVEKNNLSIAKRDYHSLEWRAYANAQLGVWDQIATAINIVGAAAEKTQDARLAWYAEIMEARYLLARETDDGRPLPKPVAGEGRYGNAHADMLLAIGLAAGKANNIDRAEQTVSHIAKLISIAEEEKKTYQANYLSIIKHQLKGSVAMARGQTEEALKQLEKASLLEEKQDPPSGPTSPIKPSHELYGEFLLKAGKDDKAIELFRLALTRTPNRTPSLLGLARASMKVGDLATASQTYEKLQTLLVNADSRVPYLNEVQTFSLNTDAEE